LGFRILMSNRHEWTTTKIIEAYQGQSNIENAFKNIKNPYHLAVRPQFHWTDQKIRVHFFMCFLGYLLASIIWRETKKKNAFKGTLDNLLDTLNRIRLATLLEKTKTKGKMTVTYKLEEMDKEQKKIIKVLGLENYHNKRPKINGVGVYK